MPAEQIARLECLVQHLGGLDMCDPEGDKVDSSICQFIMFVMRDVLSYLSLHKDNQATGKAHPG